MDERRYKEIAEGSSSEKNGWGWNGLAWCKKGGLGIPGLK
jgi:hypothetical protein